MLYSLRSSIFFEADLDSWERRLISDLCFWENPKEPMIGFFDFFGDLPND